MWSHVMSWSIVQRVYRMSRVVRGCTKALSEWFHVEDTPRLYVDSEMVLESLAETAADTARW